MKDVKVKTAELLTKIKANRAAHRELFLKAQDGFRQRAIEELDRMLQQARDGQAIRLYVGLDAPEDHTNDYDRVIAMLEMSTDKEVTIDARSFQQFALDQWDWKALADIKNSTYASGGFVSRS